MGLCWRRTETPWKIRVPARARHRKIGWASKCIHSQPPVLYPVRAVGHTKTNNLTFCPRQGCVCESLQESADNFHGRDSMDFPERGTFRSLWQTSGEREGRLAGQMQFAMPVCAHTAGESLSPTDSDCGTERSGAQAGGRRSSGHAQRSGVKRSEPDGVRPVWRRAVCDFQQSEATAESSQSARRGKP